MCVCVCVVCLCVFGGSSVGRKATLHGRMQPLLDIYLAAQLGSFAVGQLAMATCCALALQKKHARDRWDSKHGIWPHSFSFPKSCVVLHSDLTREFAANAVTNALQFETHPFVSLGQRTPARYSGHALRITCLFEYLPAYLPLVPTYHIPAGRRNARYSPTPCPPPPLPQPVDGHLVFHHHYGSFGPCHFPSVAGSKLSSKNGRVQSLSVWAVQY